MSDLLDVYFRETKAGVLARLDDGMLTFSYDGAYLEDQKSRAISFSMPLQEQPFGDPVVRPFFSGLLPDEGARQRLAGALGLSSGNAFGLLEVIGGECAGALSLYPAGTVPEFLTPELSSTAEIETLTPERLDEILARLRARPLLGGEDGIRLSLAGAQDKLAVIVQGASIALAKAGRPTTHILKPFIQALEGTVENEYFCMRLAGRLKLPVPRVQMRLGGATAFLLVERYDRTQNADDKIERLHQEDFCQALSVPPELKYEAEGGPGVRRSLALIDEACARPVADRLGFIRMLIFHYLVGNADAHGKNFALLYRSATPDLAPLYDVVCTAVYPRLSKRLAMRIGDRDVPDTIQLQHWMTLVPDTKAAKRILVRDLAQMAERIVLEADALAAELADEGIKHPILKAICKVISSRAGSLRRLTQQVD
jgi:serine/threonine-protein kinase HipA